MNGKYSLNEIKKLKKILKIKSKKLKPYLDSKIKGEIDVPALIYISING